MNRRQSRQNSRRQPRPRPTPTRTKRSCRNSIPHSKRRWTKGSSKPHGLRKRRVNRAGRQTRSKRPRTQHATERAKPQRCRNSVLLSNLLLVNGPNIAGTPIGRNDAEFRGIVGRRKRKSQRHKRRNRRLVQQAGDGGHISRHTADKQRERKQRKRRHRRRNARLPAQTPRAARRSVRAGKRWRGAWTWKRAGAASSRRRCRARSLAATRKFACGVTFAARRSSCTVDSLGGSAFAARRFALLVHIAPPSLVPGYRLESAKADPALRHVRPALLPQCLVRGNCHRIA